MHRRWLPICAVVAAATATLGVWLVRPSATIAAPTQEPVTVGVVRAVAKDVPVYLTALGTVTALATVGVRSQVTGTIVSIKFKEGQTINKGDLLAKIDSRYLEAQYSQAKSQGARDRAMLANSLRDLERYRAALDTGKVTRQALDSQQALVDEARATIAADEAAVDAAKVQLQYTTIRSPIAGIVGLRAIDEGNLVQAGDSTALATIVSVRPISVVFPVPQQALASLVEALKRGGALQVEAMSTEGNKVLARGVTAALDNIVDATSGTIKVKAVFGNDESTLYPGAFVQVRLKLRTLKSATVVPSRAIVHGARGDALLTVDTTGKTRSIPVKIAFASLEETAVVSKEIKPGDIVIVDGAARVTAGMAVKLRQLDTASKNDRRGGPGAEEGGDKVQMSAGQ